MKKIALAAAAAVLLAGCTGQAPTAETEISQQPSPSASTTQPVDLSTWPTVPSNAPQTGIPRAVSYDSLEDLKEAIIDTGYDCSGWEQDDVVDLAAESGHCSGGDVVMIFATFSAQDEQLQFYKRWASTTGEISYSLVGPNWVVHHSYQSSLDIIRQGIGGRIEVHKP